MSGRHGTAPASAPPRAGSSRGPTRDPISTGVIAAMRIPLLAALLLLPTLAPAQAVPLPAAATGPAAPTRPVISLEEAVQSARAHQPQLRQAQAVANAAAAQADESRAGLLPQLSAAAAYERATSNAFPGSSAARTQGKPSWSSSDTWSASVTLGQVLFDPMQLRTWRAAGATAQASQESARVAALDVVSGAQSAYFSARAERDLVAVARETVRNDETHLRQTQAFVEVGTQPAIALAQTRASLATAQLQLIQAENGYASARATLQQAMGVAGSLDFDVGDDTLPAVPGEDSPLDALVEEASAARPELASLAQQVRAQELTRAAATAGYLPTVSAQASATDTGPHVDDTVGNWSATINLGWSLFDGGLTRARVQAADANLASLQAQADTLRLSIRVGVQQAQLGVRAARSSVAAAGDAQVNAREQLRLAEGRYQAGAGSIIELGDAQVAASSAGAQQVQAEYNLAAARAALLRALGRE